MYGELEEEEYDSDELYGEESLERRLARLRREVEEIKGEVAAREEEEAKRGGEAKREGEEREEGEEEEEEEELEDGTKLLRLGIDDLSDALEGLQTVPAEERGAQAKLAKKLATSLSVPRTTPTQTTTSDAAAPETEVSPLKLSYRNSILTPSPGPHLRPHNLLHSNLRPHLLQIPRPRQSRRLRQPPHSPRKCPRHVRLLPLRRPTPPLLRHDRHPRRTLSENDRHHQHLPFHPRRGLPPRQAAHPGS